MSVDNSAMKDYHSVLEGLLTVQEIANLLSVPKSYVYYLTHQKRIPHLKIQGILRFEKSAIDLWLRSQEVTECRSTKGNSET